MAPKRRNLSTRLGTKSSGDGYSIVFLGVDVMQRDVDEVTLWD
jgi:hypothetical protein